MTVEVTLREVTADTVRAVCRLQVGPGQERFVAANAVSIAQAYFEPKAWFRAIYAAEDPVGFVMLYDDPEKPEYYLWRLMIAAEHQRKGYGREALRLLVEHVRSRPGARELLTSAVPGEGSPRPFYESVGFVATGEVDDGEEVLRLALD
ncbi:MAG: GNAT family N-acetyltransferase [Acidimicrobiia bacterium]|jgi:diamine N-acetyltransferase|nr:GNAT family N-acetyltransferase [Acidimicrobiia bacterium]